jgi:uncharacterized protein (DUF697 family)
VLELAFAVALVVGVASGFLVRAGFLAFVPVAFGTVFGTAFGTVFGTAFGFALFVLSVVDFLLFVGFDIV